MIKKIIFGSNSLIGKNLYKIIKNKKECIFISKSDKRFFVQNLDKKLKLKQKKNEFYDIIFLSSPYYILKNYKKKILLKEYLWLKKVLSTYKINKFVYLSSPSIYYKKSLIGNIKKKCEKLIIKNKTKIKFYQIWRPFNLIGKNSYLSDHFHNIAFKKIFIEKKNHHFFNGSPNDKRAYSEADNFAKILYKYFKINKSFVFDYGNNNLISTRELIKIYKKKLREKFDKEFIDYFKSKKSNVSVIKKRKNSIIVTKSSKVIINNYLNKMLNETKM